MAIGDVVSGQGVANTILTFQPAVGVECIITQAGSSVAGWIYLTDGVKLTGMLVTHNGATTDANNSMKLFVTNSLYLQLPANGAGTIGAYCGLQIK